MVGNIRYESLLRHVLFIYVWIPPMPRIALMFLDNPVLNFAVTLFMLPKVAIEDYQPDQMVVASAVPYSEFRNEFHNCVYILEIVPAHRFNQKQKQVYRP